VLANFLPETVASGGGRSKAILRVITKVKSLLFIFK
jgi:hypothetical protein